MEVNNYLIVFAPVYGPSGYAKLSRNYILGLDKLGVKIKVEPNKLWEPHETMLPSADYQRLKELEKTVIPKGCVPPKLSIGIAPWFDRNYPGYKIGYTMFEFENIPNLSKYDWKAGCLAMDEVWVPSQFNLKSFNDNGINNVSVVAPGIDTSAFNPSVKPLISRDDRVRFLAVGEFTPRKGYDLLIPAYLAEFNSSEKVSLILKAYKGTKSPEESKKLVKEDIVKYRSESPNPSYPHILFIGDIINSDKLPSLYTSADVFTLLTRGEGFGLPMAEAMSCGLPCVLPDNSSYMDFVNNDNGYLVNVNGTEKFTELYKASILYKDSMSPVIDVTHARKILRRIYTNIKEARARGIRARESVVDEYSLEASSRRMLDKLREIDPYWTAPIVNLVTDNFDELVLPEEDIPQNSPSDERGDFNINVVGKSMDKVGTIGVLIPTWGENCGVADYTKKLIERLRIKHSVNVVKNMFNLVDTVQRVGIRVVHIQHHYALYNEKKLSEVIDILKSMRVKVLLTVHDYASDIRMGNANSCFLKCDQIFVHSNMIKERMLQDGVATPNKIATLIMGAEPPYSLDKNSAKQNIGVPGRRIITSFGFLQPHKNWVEVVKAIPKIKEQIPDIMYLIVSNVKKGNQVIAQCDRNLDSTIERLGVGNYVKRFKNTLSEDRVLQMLAASEVIVLPYNNYRVSGVEYWGVSIASRFCMRVQRPLIVSNASFFSDLQNISQVVVPTSSEIAKNVTNLMGDTSLQRKIVMRQYNFCNMNSWDTFSEKTIMAYKEVLTRE